MFTAVRIRSLGILLFLMSLFGSENVVAAVDLSGDYRLHSSYYSESSYLSRGGNNGTPSSSAYLDTLHLNWDSEKWTFEDAGNGYYRIVSHWGRESGYLSRGGVRNSDDTGWVPGPTVYIAKLGDGWSSQLWKVDYTGDGRYRLQNAWDPDTGYLSRLGVPDGNGGWRATSEMRLYGLQDWDSQKWTLQPFSLDCSWVNPANDKFVANYTLVADSGRYGMRIRPHRGCRDEREVRANHTINVVARDGEWLYGQNLDTGQWGWVDQSEFADYDPEAGTTIELAGAMAFEAAAANAGNTTRTGRIRLLNGDWCVSYNQIAPRTFRPALRRCATANGRDPSQIWTVHQDGRISIKIDGVDKCMYGGFVNDTVGLQACSTGNPGFVIYPQWDYTSGKQFRDPSRAFDGSSLCFSFGASGNGVPLIMVKCGSAVRWEINTPITDYSILYTHCYREKRNAQRSIFSSDYDCHDLAQAAVDADGDAEKFVENIAILMFRENRQRLQTQQMLEMFSFMLEGYGYAFNIFVRNLTISVCELGIRKRSSKTAVVAKPKSNWLPMGDSFCEDLYVRFLSLLDRDSTYIDLACEQNNQLLCEMGRSRDRRSGAFSASLLGTVTRVASAMNVDPSHGPAQRFAKECLRRGDKAIRDGHRIGGRFDGLYLIDGKLKHPCEVVTLYFPSQNHINQAALLRDYAIDRWSQWVYQKYKPDASKVAWYRGYNVGTRWDDAPLFSWKKGCEEWTTNPWYTPSGQDCDEFPPTKTYAGRASGRTNTLPQPAIRGLSSSDNRREGSWSKSNVYEACALRDKSDFMVIPLTTNHFSQFEIPSVSLKSCRGN